MSLMTHLSRICEPQRSACHDKPGRNGEAAEALSVRERLILFCVASAPTGSTL
jgi:hypothetical protein